MKRLSILAVVMGLFYITMASFSSAEQKPEADVSAAAARSKAPDSKDSDYSDLERDDLKEGLTRAFYDALMDSKNDIENSDNEGLSGRETIVGPDGKERTVFQEARRTIFEADQILSRVKAQNKKALERLRNPPRRVIPGQKPLPKENSARNENSIKQQIEVQKKRVVQEQQKLQQLQNSLETQTAEK